MEIKTFKYRENTHELTIKLSVHCHASEVPSIVGDIRTVVAGLLWTEEEQNRFSDVVLEPTLVLTEEMVDGAWQITSQAIAVSMPEEPEAVDLDRAVTVIPSEAFDELAKDLGVDAGQPTQEEVAADIAAIPEVAEAVKSIDYVIGKMPPPAPELFEGHVIVSRRVTKQGVDAITLFNGEEVMLSPAGEAMQRRTLPVATSAAANWAHANRWKAGMVFQDQLVTTVKVLSESRTDLTLEGGTQVILDQFDNAKLFLPVTVPTPEPEPTPSVGMDPSVVMAAFDAQAKTEPAVLGADGPIEIEDPVLEAVRNGKTVQDVVRGVADALGKEDFEKILAWCKANKLSVPRLNKVTEPKFDSAVKRAYTMVAS